MTFSKHAAWHKAASPTTAVGEAAKRTLKEKFWDTAKNPVVQMAALPAIGFGADAAVQGIAKLLGGAFKARAYKSMLEENPHLKKFPEADTQRYFNTLHRVDPDSAKDPLVAGAWVYEQQQANVPGFPHSGVIKGVSDIAQIRGALSKSKERRPGLGMEYARQLPQSMVRIREAVSQEPLKKVRGELDAERIQHRIERQKAQFERAEARMRQEAERLRNQSGKTVRIKDYLDND